MTLESWTFWPYFPMFTLAYPCISQYVPHPHTAATWPASPASHVLTSPLPHQHSLPEQRPHCKAPDLTTKHLYLSGRRASIWHSPLGMTSTWLHDQLMFLDLGIGQYNSNESRKVSLPLQFSFLVSPRVTCPCCEERQGTLAERRSCHVSRSHHVGHSCCWHTWGHHRCFATARTALLIRKTKQRMALLAKK